MKNKVNLFIGSYNELDNESISCYIVDRISLNIQKIASVRGVINPSYLTITSDRKKLYSVLETMEFDNGAGGAVASYTIDENRIIKDSILGTEGTLPCHILLDERQDYIYTANYWDGSLSMFKLGLEGNIERMCDFKKHTGIGPNKERQEGPHAHYIGFDENKKGIWCVDLGIDTLVYYTIDKVNNKLVNEAEKNIELPKGSGPRHFVLGSEEFKLMYIVCELTSEVIVVDYDNNSIVQRISTIEKDVKNSSCSAIKITKEKNYLYVANRGDNSIAVFQVEEDGFLERIQLIKSGGKNPRDFEIDDDLMFIANQDSNNVKIYKIDKATGKLKSTEKSIEMKSAACVLTAK